MRRFKNVQFIHFSVVLNPQRLISMRAPCMRFSARQGTVELEIEK
jgi:hypothetical protein